MLPDRRLILAGLPALIGLSGLRLAQAQAVPSADSLAFTVWRKGERIGDHTVKFSRQGDSLAVQTHAHFSVGFGPIAFFTYTYDVTETWASSTLQHISAHTNDNGTRQTCEAHRSGDAMLVQGSRSGSYTAPKGSIAGTHWNRAEMAAPMINPENGLQMRFSVADRGMSAPPGGGAPAHHYALTGFAKLDLWYDAADSWVGLAAVAKDGSAIEYRKI